MSSAEEESQYQYSGETLYAYGGSSGIGEMGASRFALGGGRVVVFSSQQLVEDGQSIFPTVEKAKARMRRRGVDTDLITGVYTNQKLVESIPPGIQQMKDVPPNHVFSASAGGVDTFADEFRDDLLELTGLRESDDLKKDEKIALKIAEVNRKIVDRWLPDAWEEGMAINYTGQISTFEALAEEFPNDEFDIVFLNSIFGHSGVGPPHYKVVAQTKRKTREWIEQQAPYFTRRGKSLGELVLPAVSRTGVGTMILEWMMPFYPERLQEAILDTTISKEDAATALEVLWNMSPQERVQGPHPYTLFATRHKGELTISQEIPAAWQNIDVSLFPF